MFLLIFESIGTSELLLIGVVALIFLGPRKLPEIAKKIGKIMAEFRGTANDFRATWEREVDFEEEKKALRLDLIEDEAVKPVARENNSLAEAPAILGSPAIKEIEKEHFDSLAADAVENKNGALPESELPKDEPDLLSDKRNWL